MAKQTNTPVDSSVTELDDTPAVAAKTDAAADADADVVVRADGVPAGFSGKRRYITLHPSEGEAGKQPVNFGINGFVITIKRNEKVAVLEEFVQHILDCKTDLVDTNGTVAGSQPRFSFTDHGEA